MDLHRTTKQPEWKKTKKRDYSNFQKLAANTNGIVTPANIVTLVGFGLVVGGLVALLQHHYWLGLVLLWVGRIFDIVDGFVAQATHTKSPVGEILDAVIDKVEMLLTIIVLLTAHITTWWVIAALVIPQLLISLISLDKRRHGVRLHPSGSGKLSMAAAWGGIVGLILMKALHDSLLLAILSYALIGASVLFGLYAAGHYVVGRD
jgi:cardiolipin synthase